MQHTLRILLLVDKKLEKLLTMQLNLSDALIMNMNVGKYCQVYPGRTVNLPSAILQAAGLKMGVQFVKSFPTQ